MIFFDIDNTLIDYNGSERRAIVSLFKKEYEKSINDDQTDYWKQISKSLFDDYLAKRITFEEQGKVRFIKMGQFCGIQINDIDAEIMFRKYQNELTVSWELFDDVEETLYVLKEERLGIISNGNAKQQQSKLINTGIDHYFDIKIFSEDVGVAKPGAEIFKKAIELSKEDIRRIIYVGDNVKTDILPCEKIGIKGILIDRDKEYSVKYCKINSLVELKELEIQQGEK